MTWPRGRARDGGIDEVPVPGVPGRLWLCGKHAVGPDPEAVLTRLGATTIVCLNEVGELADRYPAYVSWLEANHPRRAVAFAMHDLHAPGVDAVLPVLDDLHTRLAAGDGLVVHCGAGIGRAGTVAVALLLRAGLDLDAALTTVARSRPMAGPEAGAQRALLDSLRQRLSEPR